MSRKFKSINNISAEILEDRLMLSGVDLVNGVLTINGTNQADSVSLNQDGGQLFVNLNDKVSYFDAALVNNINVYLKNGHDNFVSQVNVPVNVFGGNGNDNLLIVSSLANNKLNGGNGNDLVSSTGAGSDTLLGGNGKDTLYFIVGAPNVGLGGKGSDVLIGRDGVDVHDKARNDDLVAFRFDRPKVDLRDGVLYLMGDNGNDSYTVKTVGNKLVVTLNDVNGLQTFTFNKNDVNMMAGILLGGDDVFINNTSVRSVFYGAGGNDTLVGGSSDDVLKGGGGEDFIDGGRGTNFLTGDAGADFITSRDKRDFVLLDRDDVFRDLSFLDKV